MIELNADNVFILLCALFVMYGTYWLTIKKDNEK